MSDFKAIETQEQLDEVLKDRLKRERDTVLKDFEGYLSPTEIAEKYKDYLSPEDAAAKYKDYLPPEDVAKLQSKIKGYETDSAKTRIALELGLDYKAVGFLQGDDEESIRKSAESLKSLVGANNVAPLASNEAANENKGDAALLQTLRNLDKGE